MPKNPNIFYRKFTPNHPNHPKISREPPTPPPSPDAQTRLCGDKLKVFVKLNGNKIEDVSFKGAGCSISTASASMMTEALKGKSLPEAQALFDRFHEVLTGPPDESTEAEDLGKLAAFHGVRRFPVRVKCATLAWHTLQAALKDDHAAVSTE